MCFSFVVYFMKKIYMLLVNGLNHEKISKEVKSIYYTIV